MANGATLGSHRAFWIGFVSLDSSPANLLWAVDNILEFLLGVCSPRLIYECVPLPDLLNFVHHTFVNKYHSLIPFQFSMKILCNI